MNTSATSAASRAEYDALDANSARSPDYLPNVLLLLQLPTTYFLRWRRTPSAFLLQNSGKTAAASQRRTPRAFRAGGTLVVRVAMSATRLQIGIIRPVYRPYLRTLPCDAWTLPSGEIHGIFHCVFHLQRLEAPNTSASSIARL